MKNISQRGSVLAVAAILAACAAPPGSEPRSTPSEARETQLPKAQAERDARDAESYERREAIEMEPLPVDVAHPTAPRSEAKRVLATSVAPSPPVGASAIACCLVPYQPAVNTERYEHLSENPVRVASEYPVSTFSIDVDTGAYANVRRFLNAGSLPPQDAVRVEEMINYFDYQYTPPKDRSTPFRVSTELTTAPWNAESLLLKVGIKGYEVAATNRPAANLVFLIDVSGSMQSPDKLPLLKNAFRLLADQLSARDRISIVVYAGTTGVVLEPTPGDQKQRIRDAIDRLEAGGSTNGAAGIERAYQLARAGRVEGGINRVVLATDGDFNVGVVNFEALTDLAERERASGVALTTLGFGTGNYNDKLLERLADAGNGNYAYIDTLAEARKVLVTEVSATLMTIAKDVKIQVEFNPAEVLEYRLIGYENRALAREDFSNDKVDAGEIGAGHRVTALYEIVPVGAKGRVEPLRYAPASTVAAKRGELAHVRLRYKQPNGDQSRLLEYPVMKRSLNDFHTASHDLRFAVGVAAFGQLLRGGKYLNDFGYEEVAALASAAMGEDRDGYRREFVSLVKLAQSLAPEPFRSEDTDRQQVGQISP